MDLGEFDHVKSLHEEFDEPVVLIISRFFGGPAGAYSSVCREEGK
jgi:hypothetical protein